MKSRTELHAIVTAVVFAGNRIADQIAESGDLEEGPGRMTDKDEIEFASGIAGMILNECGLSVAVPAGAI